MSLRHSFRFEFDERSLEKVERAFAAGFELQQVVVRNPRTGEERVIIIPKRDARIYCGPLSDCGDDIVVGAA